MGIKSALLGSARPAPTFLTAGAGNVEVPTSGTLQVAFPATVAQDRFAIMVVYCQDSTAVSITTPGGWNSPTNNAITSSGLNVRMAWFWKKTSGSEGSTNENVTVQADVFAMGQIFILTSGSGVEASDIAQTATSATNMDAVNVTSGGANRLLIQILAALGSSRTIGNISGETPADYTEATGEYSNTSGLISLQVAAAPTPTTETGGSATLSANCTARIRAGAAIIP